jgi:hypothetical protein
MYAPPALRRSVTDIAVLPSDKVSQRYCINYLRMQFSFIGVSQTTPLRRDGD